MKQSRIGLFPSGDRELSLRPLTPAAPLRKNHSAELRSRLLHDGSTEDEIRRLRLEIQRLQRRVDTEIVTTTQATGVSGGNGNENGTPEECPEVTTATSGWIEFRFKVPAIEPYGAWKEQPIFCQFPQWYMVTDCYVVVEKSLTGTESGQVSIGEPYTDGAQNQVAYSGYADLLGVDTNTHRMYHWYRGNRPAVVGCWIGIPRGYPEGTVVDDCLHGLSLWYQTSGPPANVNPIVHVLLRYGHLTVNPWYE